jgi:hypothetical protein
MMALGFILAAYFAKLNGIGVEKIKIKDYFFSTSK